MAGILQRWAEIRQAVSTAAGSLTRPVLGLLGGSASVRERLRRCQNAHSTE